MENLHLIGVYEDGEFLLLGGPDGKSRYRLRLDDSLRAAVRWEHGASRVRPVHAEPLRPRDVQTMIRAGASAEEAAERAGWTVEKVRRYEGPILAEREHMAWLAGLAVLRSRNAVSFAAPTLGERVGDRLSARGVEAESVRWDSWRSEDGQWTVELHFTAGGRARTASWHFNRSTMTVVAVDDEARWLSEEEHAGQTPTARHVVTSGRAHVYDIEAEGGLEPPVNRHTEAEPAARTAPVPAAPARGGESDLLNSMRERSAARIRRRPPRLGASSPTDVPTEDLADIELPALEQLDYDPDTMPPPPAAHADPQPDGLDGRPEPAAQADAPTLAQEPQLSFDTDENDPVDSNLVEKGNLVETENLVQPDNRVETVDESDPLDDEPEDLVAHLEERSTEAHSEPRRSTPEADGAAPTPTPATASSVPEPSDDKPANPEAAAPESAKHAQEDAPQDQEDEPASASTAADTEPAAAKPAAPARRGGTPRAQPRQRGARAGKPRASVPAWDDIVFGGGKPSGE